MWEKLSRHEGQWRRRGKEVFETPEQRTFAWSSWWRPWWGRLCPCSPWNSMVEQTTMCSLWKGPHARAGGWMPEGSCDPVGSPRWSRFLPGPVAPWREEPRLEQVCWQGLWPHGGPTLEQPIPEGWHPLGRTHAGAVREELQPMGRTHVGAFRGGLSAVGGTPRWSRGGAWGGRRGRENMWWTDHNPHSLSPCATWGRR